MLIGLLIALLGLPGLEGTIRITPGKAVNEVLLDSSIEELQKKLGARKPGLAGKGTGAPQTYIWMDREHRTILRAWAKGGKIIQLDIWAQTVLLPSGIGNRSPIAMIVNQSGMECYEELHSAAHYSGEKNVLYAVDRKQGVAFRFQHWNPEANPSAVGQPYVAGVIVFSPGKDVRSSSVNPIVPCKFAETDLPSDPHP